MLWEKVKLLLSSIRFWIVTLTAVLAILQQVSSGVVDMNSVIDVIKIWLGVVAGLGTIDSVAIKFGRGVASRNR